MTHGDPGRQRGQHQEDLRGLRGAGHGCERLRYGRNPGRVRVPGDFSRSITKRSCETDGRISEGRQWSAIPAVIAVIHWAEGNATGRGCSTAWHWPRAPWREPWWTTRHCDSRRLGVWSSLLSGQIQQELVLRCSALFYAVGYTRRAADNLFSSHRTNFASTLFYAFLSLFAIILQK